MSTAGTEVRQPDLFTAIRKAEEEIKKREYWLWRCRNLGGAVICVVEDRRCGDAGGPKARVMQKYPTYTLNELRLLSRADTWTRRMVLEIKGMLPGTVVVPPPKREVVPAKQKGFWGVKG